MKTISLLFASFPLAAAVSAGAQTLETSAASLGSSRPLLYALAGQGTMRAPQLNGLFDAARARAPLAVPPPPPAAPPTEAFSAPVAAPLAAPVGRPRTAARPLVIPVPVQSPAYRRTFRILLAHPELTDRYDDLVLKYAHQYRLDPRLVKAIVAAESEFYKRAVSPAGARGLMQLMPRTAEYMGVPREYLFDPEYNIRAGVSYLAHLFERAWKIHKRQGTSYMEAPLWILQRVIAAYNAGPRFLRRDKWYRQTRGYVRKVLLYYHSRVTDIRRAALPRREPERAMMFNLGTLP